ncbi:MAG: hypothetical protein K1X28_04985 [Parachlamydiales bacterium]|nr:hypothetical protein [Parachlamydiales bacterium]
MKNKLFLILLTTGMAFADIPSGEIANCQKPQPCAPKCNPCPRECWMQGEPLTGQYAPAYNAPAIWNVCGREFDMGCNNKLQAAFFADASFLYWYGGEEGLAIASNGVLNSGIVYFATETKTYYQGFDYKPGFKVGFGFVGNHSWSTYAEYTWLRGENTSSFSAPSNDLTAGTTAALTGTPVLLVGDWFLNGTAVGQALSASHISSKWHYALDLVDLCASRPFYEGPRLTVNPYGGLRLAFIRQKMIVELTQPAAAFGGSLPAAVPPEPIGSRNYSHSWGIGPRFGADVYWLFCHGFRLEADLAASLLYTRYTKVTHSEDPASSSFNPGSYKTSMNDYNCLRPMTELGLGLGWGTYLYGSMYHLDFSASYDFTYMWNQNMIRKLLDDTLTGTSPSSADLYFHGLTFTSRFDF